MIREIEKHLINQDLSIKDALIKLDVLASDAILFVVDSKNQLLGSLTDGDIRRGLIKGISIDSKVKEVIQSNPKFIRKGNYDLQDVVNFRDKNFQIIPVLSSEDDTIVNIINFRSHRSYLPVDAVIMAGGKGTRLRPLTLNTPKPLLKVGGKPIMEHNLDRLSLFGIDDFHVSVNYLGDQLVDYFGNGENKNIKIDYIWEKEPLGTIGALATIGNIQHDYVLVTNSDLLTNLDYESFFIDFVNKDADLCVVTIPYKVDIPYAVLETSDDRVINFKEKPTYTYYSNGGIYLMKKEVLNLIPKDSFYNATDLMEALIVSNKKVVSYPFVGYWLDVGKHEDFEKAQDDILKVKF
jgi:dTDP-glucose pyrophosphorylase